MPPCRTAANHIIVLLLFLTSSCSERSDTASRHFQILEEGLQTATARMASENETVYHGLHEALLDPGTHYKASIWEPKAVQIKQYASGITTYIERLKKELKRIADSSDGNDVVSKFFQQGQQGTRLFEELKSFETNALALAPALHQEFSKAALLPKPLGSLSSASDFHKHYIEKASYASAQALLSQLLNSVKITENKLLLFCHEQLANRGNFIHVYSPIIAQSSSYVRPGETMEIIAGVGAFRVYPYTKFTINGKEVPMDENATARYSFKAPAKPGKYIVPAQIEYMNEEGRVQTITKAVEYAVAKD